MRRPGTKIRVDDIWSRAPALKRWQRRQRQRAAGRGQHRHRRQVRRSDRSYKSLNEALVHGGIANNARSTCTTSTPRTAQARCTTSSKAAMASWSPAASASAASRARSPPSSMPAKITCRLRHLPGHAGIVAEFARNISLEAHSTEFDDAERGWKTRTRDRPDGNAAKSPTRAAPCAWAPPLLPEAR